MIAAMQEKQYIIAESLIQQAVGYIATVPTGQHTLAESNNLVNALRQLQPVKEAPPAAPKPKRPPKRPTKT